MSTGYLRLDGGSVLIGLIGKCVRTSTFGESHIFRFHPHPCWMRLESEGLSHSLKTCHRHVFLTAFRVPSLSQTKISPNPKWDLEIFGASVLIGLF